MNAKAVHRAVKKQGGEFFRLRIGKDKFGVFTDVPVACAEAATYQQAAFSLDYCLERVCFVEAKRREKVTIRMPKAHTTVTVRVAVGTRLLNIFGSSRSLAMHGIDCDPDWVRSPMRVGKAATTAQIVQAVHEAGVTVQRSTGDNGMPFVEFWIPKHLPPSERERLLRAIQKATLMPPRDEGRYPNSTIARFVEPSPLPIQSRQCECGECEILLAG